MEELAIAQTQVRHITVGHIVMDLGCVLSVEEMALRKIHILHKHNVVQVVMVVAVVNIVLVQANVQDAVVVDLCKIFNKSSLQSKLLI